MIRHFAFPAGLSWLMASALILTGCSEEPAISASMTLEVPAKLRQNLAIDSSQVSAQLTVNGRTVDVVSSGNGIWNATVMVPANRNTTLTVVWYETVDGTRLQLANRTQTIMVGEAGGSVDFSGSYVTSGAGFDADGDGYSNYDERTLGTDPLLSDDSPSSASLSLSVELPDRFKSMDSGYTVLASSNGTIVPLEKNDNLYSATISDLAAGTSVDLVTSIESGQYGSLLLGRSQQEVPVVAGGNSISVVAGNFNLGFDEDNDGVTNLREVERGRNPLTVYDYLVAKTSNPPQVDGQLNDSAWRGRFAAGGLTSGARRINRFVQSDSGTLATDGLLSEWAAVVDNDNLYIGIRILDKSFHFDSGDITVWDDDGIEIYLDGDNSKWNTFDGVNDFKMNFRVGDQTLLQYPGSATLPQNLVFELSVAGFDSDIAEAVFETDFDRDAVTDKGFNLEISMPLSELGVAPGGAFGINIHYNDDDDGGNRDVKTVWIGEEGQDVDYLDPSKLGTAQIKPD